MDIVFHKGIYKVGIEDNGRLYKGYVYHCNDIAIVDVDEDDENSFSTFVVAFISHILRLNLIVDEENYDNVRDNETYLRYLVGIETMFILNVGTEVEKSGIDGSLDYIFVVDFIFYYVGLVLEKETSVENDDRHSMLPVNLSAFMPIIVMANVI